MTTGNRVAIVGYGHVGKGMHKIFSDVPVGIIDPDRGYHWHSDARDCRLAIVCVPTPSREDGSCDTSIVERVVAELESEFILIKSTVTPGTTLHLTEKHSKRIVFSPEYMGESAYWTPPWAPAPFDPVSHGFCVLGGPQPWCSAIADMLLPKLGPATRFRFMTSTEAELVKYFENAFFALKVTFANQMRNVCERVSVNVSVANYHVVREGWLDDPRVGPMHSLAFKHKPGFDGKCLPKDLVALAHFCHSVGSPIAAVLMESIAKVNSVSIIGEEL